MRKPFHTRLIHKGDPEEFLRLYREKQMHLDNIDSLKQSSRNPSEVALQIERSEEAIHLIEEKLAIIGLPLDPNELIDVYDSVEKAIQTLNDAREITGWLKANFPPKYNRKLTILDSIDRSLNPQFTGKWKGTWRSKTDQVRGNVVMAICQVDNIIIGSGAFTNSIFQKAYLEGDLEGEEFNIELFADYVPVTCRTTGILFLRHNAMEIRGTYDIAGYDYGEFRAAKEASSMNEQYLSMPVKALAIFANPKGSDPLRLGEEDRVLHECIRLSKLRDRISMKVKHAAQIHDVRRALLDEEYEIIHFSGHGTGKGLALEDQNGSVMIIPSSALADLLAAYSPPVKCVILNACYSISQGQLVAMNVPYTIAMNDAISDGGAIEFTRGFYDAIGAGKDLEFAFQEGCRAIKLSGLPDDTVPVLLKNIV